MVCEADWFRFQPNVFEKAIGLRGKTWGVRNVDSVGVVPPTGGLFSGGVRTRLAISHRKEGDLLFVVSDPSAAAEKLRMQ